MKKITFCLAAAFLFACGNDTSTTTDDTTTTPTTPVENVNGNVPDTTNSITPGVTNKTPDSSHLRDSLRGDSARR